MAQEYRPVLDIPTTKAEKTYDNISLGLVVAIIVSAVWSFFNLPETIPIHWNTKGVADGFGSKYWIAFIPIISVLIYFGLSAVTKIPHKFNYIKKITPNNVRAEYIYGRKLIRIVHLISQIVFGLIIYFTIRGSLTENTDMGVGGVIFLCALLFLPLAFVVYRYSCESEIS